MSQTKTVQERSALLLLKVPRTNDKKELAAEQMFASIHGLLTKEKKGFFGKALREHISFEIAALDKQIGFYIWVPEYLKSYVEEQVYAQYPSVQISEIDDYMYTGQFTTQIACDLKLHATDVLPIMTFPNFEVDPLAAITASLAKLNEDERSVIQVLIRPVPSNWYAKSQKYIESIQSQSLGLTKLLLSGNDASNSVKLSPQQQARLKGAEEKAQKLMYETKIRIIYQGNTDTQHAKMRLQAIVAAFKQFNSTNLNGFTSGSVTSISNHRKSYDERSFVSRGSMFNIEELASLFHLPHTNVETPFILWASARTAEPPANLPIIENQGYDPEVVSPVAVTNFRGHNTSFGLPRSDRGRHLYIIGQTGVGKSGLLELLTISDIHSRYGFAVIDPHGDYALSTLKRIPAHRVQDVIYFNPADTDFPIAFNPMEVYDPKLKTHTCSELIGVLKRMFDSWGPRLEYILRYSILALLDYPDTTMLDITRILTDKKFRNEVIGYVEDPVVRNFWTVEFASWNDKFATEAVAPILNKVGAFTANPTVRNIIGQPKSSFNIRKIMDERKILIVNLSRGLIGEDNASLLGALLVTKIQMGAMSRADIDQKDRAPFYLYVDEFQNFATDSFATILSEARKYGLCLTVANQYIAQMSLSVRDAVFGNVGSIIAFRMGADDARVMQRYFEPKFEEHDLVHMHNRNFVVSMTIAGEKVQAFSGTSLALPQIGEDFTSLIIEQSRQLYAFHKKDIENFVQNRYIDPERKKQQQAPSSQPQPEAFPAIEEHDDTSYQPAAKRKRRRVRKKKPADSATDGGFSEDSTISLR